jgi:hypothetical protein
MALLRFVEAKEGGSGDLKSFYALGFHDLRSMYGTSQPLCEELIKPI